jgi:hypothetical protein
MLTNSEVVCQAYRFYGSAWVQAKRQGAIPDLDLTDLYDPDVVLDEIARRSCTCGHCATAGSFT